MQLGQQQLELLRPGVRQARREGAPDRGQRARYQIYKQLEDMLVGPDGALPIVADLLVHVRPAGAPSVSGHVEPEPPRPDRPDEGQGGREVARDIGRRGSGPAARSENSLPGRADRVTKFVIRRLVWTIPVMLLVDPDDVRDDAADQGEPVPQVGARDPGRDPGEPRIASSGSTSPGTPSTGSTLKGVFTLDLGPSMVLRSQTVNDIVAAHFPKSLELGGLAFLFAVIFGIPLGMIAALKANSALDYLRCSSRTSGSPCRASSSRPC